MIPYLFVYGTLRAAAGHAMHDVLARGAIFLGGGSVRGRLYDLGLFPAAVSAHDHRIEGEVYRLRKPEALIPELDRYEGCGPDAPAPHLFRRELTEIDIRDGGTLAAWMYWYQGDVTGGSLISSGDYLKSRTA
jgi:gamma-glutamylcyclotransferase (GGCT)/AIG2-like uncharacterized protein YtfP